MSNKKVNKLVKQAELYERLASFGSTNAFLKKLSQQGGVDLDQSISSSIANLYAKINSWIKTNGQKNNSVAGGAVNALPESLWPAAAVIGQYANQPMSKYTTMDLSKLYNTARQLAAVVTFRDMESSGQTAWMNTVSPAASALMDLTQKQSEYLSSFPSGYQEQPAASTEPAGTGSYTLPEQTIAVNTPKAIDISTQTFLKQFGVEQGFVSPTMKIDGKIGPETRAALEAYKKYLNMPSNTSLDEVVSYIKSHKEVEQKWG